MRQARADVVLVGGGLANSLIALRLKALRPGLRVLLMERARQPDDSHTWSFFHTDLDPVTLSWLRPLARHSWPGYSVRFPAHERALSTPYASISSRDLAAAVEAALGADVQRGAEVVALSPDGVECADGARVAAPLVIDGRGARGSAHLSLAWQKFVGLEVRLKAPHDLARPIVMDARVRQADGYRFLYVLPLGPEDLLVEDTRYSDGPALDGMELEAGIEAYCGRSGWTIAEVARRETGVLPIALGGDIEAYLSEDDAGVPRVGLRAALFHPTTGYSLPHAARLAEEIAAAPELTSRAIWILARARSLRVWREGAFFRTLNRMMFLAAEPDRRYRVLERFYCLNQPLIERFYAGRLTLLDRARLLIGAPPVPVLRAAAALPESAALKVRATHA